MYMIDIYVLLINISQRCVHGRHRLVLTDRILPKKSRDDGDIY